MKIQILVIGVAVVYISGFVKEGLEVIIIIHIAINPMRDGFVRLLARLFG